MIREVIEAWRLDLQYARTIKEYVQKRPLTGSVILYPGLAAGPVSMRALGGVLKTAGAQVYDWPFGINRGLTKGVLAGCLQQLAECKEEQVTLVGWSLGGVIAKLLSHLQEKEEQCFEFLWQDPAHEGAKEIVREWRSQKGVKLGLVTLGSPLNALPNNEVVLQLYRLLHGKDHERKEYWRARLYEGSKAPSVSIYTLQDQVVPWGCSVQLFNENVHQNVPLKGVGHWGLVKSAQGQLEVLRAVDEIQKYYRAGSAGAYWQRQQSAQEQKLCAPWLHYVTSQQELYGL